MLKKFTEPFKHEKINLQERDLKGKEGQTTKRAEDWKGTLKRIWRYLAESKVRLILVLIMIFLSSFFALLGPFIVGISIDEFIVDQDTELLTYALMGLAVIYLLHSTAVFLQHFWMVRIAQKTVFTMRTKLFEHLHKLPIPFFDKRKHGELMSRLTNDMENVSNTLNSSVIQIFASVLTLIGTISVMLYLSPLLTLITLMIVPAMVFGMKWITKRTGKLFKAQQKNLGELNGYIQETMSGQRIIKTFSQEDKVIEGFEQRNTELRKAGFWAQTISGFIPKLMNMLNNLSFAIIAGVGGIFALYDMITIGVIVIFAEYARQFTRPLNDLANQFNVLLSAIAGAERVFSIMDEPDEISDEDNQIDLVNVKGDVTFEHVSFSYEKEGNTVKDISFTAAVGETLAFVGPTGAGKTTMISLLSRFYDPDKGTITVDGVDISKVKRESLRKHMAFVLQDSFLFQGTIRENIRYGRLNATDEEVEEAAKLANAHSFISHMADGYDSKIDSEGEGISQGQKQLLSIARALLADPSILVLDEATSSIDTVTELKIQEALQRLMKGRTSFVIAHRLNTIQQADQILVLQEGEVIEKGSHDELLEDQGFYADLYFSQLKREVG
ncbi:multidrug ABC transporter ATP-binding protein [Salipaludibacillus keqinensis]|uniref:Multidrug ABC transporter ATP-binding protein n=1 Tax=Salipaludibacillus keqinensis TaxID=2045207 RepID=A0A323TA94_9BACI|nr:ABC transporter ATP-binding protein [Salipaludibacillus keqinensis]PYZ92321.1 multidrug ABC transporter ATP-binding protein [Salipaludibacillus keqinensis]